MKNAPLILIRKIIKVFHPSSHPLTLSTNPPINPLIDGSIVVETVTRNPCSTDKQIQLTIITIERQNTILQDDELFLY